MTKVFINTEVKLGSLEEEHANPLIFTKFGYIRQNDMALFHRWEDTPGSTNYIEGYTFDGEVVKQGFAGLSKHGVSTETDTGQVL